MKDTNLPLLPNEEFTKTRFGSVLLVVNELFFNTLSVVPITVVVSDRTRKRDIENMIERPESPNWRKQRAFFTHMRRGCKTSSSWMLLPACAPTSHLYQPQGKVMFSHASVILFTIGLRDTWLLLILVDYLVTPCHGAVSTHPTRMHSCMKLSLSNIFQDARYIVYHFKSPHLLYSSHQIGEFNHKQVFPDNPCLPDVVINLNLWPKSFVVTARKRSLRRLCFHRCLSVHREGRGYLSSGGGLCGGDPPYGNVRAVRILLECILVLIINLPGK